MPEAKKPATVWQNNDGNHSAPGVPSTRPGGRNLQEVPPLQQMPNKAVGAFAPMPEDPRRQVHAFAMHNGTLDMHYKDEHGVHTPLSPRTTAALTSQSPHLLSSMRAAASGPKPPTKGLNWSDSDSEHDDWW